jgi:hypothetical protein
MRGNSVSCSPHAGRSESTALQRRFVPYRKFAAGPGWLVVGQQIDHVGGETYSHIGLDERAAACVQQDSLICGWLREDEGGCLAMVLDGGSNADLADANRRIALWAQEHGYEVDRDWRPSRDWLPGR